MPYQKPEVLLLGPAQEMILGRKIDTTEGFSFFRPQGPGFSSDSELDN